MNLWSQSTGENQSGITFNIKSCRRLVVDENIVIIVTSITHFNRTIGTPEAELHVNARPVESYFLRVRKIKPTNIPDVGITRRDQFCLSPTGNAHQKEDKCKE